MYEMTEEMRKIREVIVKRLSNEKLVDSFITLNDRLRRDRIKDGRTEDLQEYIAIIYNEIKERIERELSESSKRGNETN